MRGHIILTTIMSKQGVTQGDPLAMICYGIATLPLIRQLQEERQGWHQIWYADDGGITGDYNDIRRVFERPKEIGPKWGYLPEPSTCILVVKEGQREYATEQFADCGFEVRTGSRYLGGYIGEKREWLKTKTDV